MRTRALGIALFSLATTVGAQVPTGWFAISAFQDSSSGIGGVWLVSPRSFEPPVPVQNLPTSLLTGLGANSIELTFDGVGFVCATTPAAAGSNVDLVWVLLDGAANVYDQSFSIGTSTAPAAGVTETSMLPNDQVVFTLSPNLTPDTSLNGQRIGILDLFSGTLAPVYLNGIGPVGTWNAITTNPEGTVAYAANVLGGSATEIWSFPVPQGGTATLVATVNGIVSNLDFDPHGDLLFSAVVGSANLGTIDILTGAVSPISNTAFLNGVVAEPGTDNLAILEFTTGSGYSVELRAPDGTSTTIAMPPPTGFGVLSGIDVQPAMARYGSGSSTGSGSYSIAWPQPGGMAYVGNSSFGVTTESTGSAATAAAVCLSLDAASIPVLGIDLWIDPGPSFLASVPVPTTPTATVPLTLTPMLVGLTFHAQSLHIESGGAIGASDALAFTVVTP